MPTILQTKLLENLLIMIEIFIDCIENLSEQINYFEHILQEFLR